MYRDFTHVNDLISSIIGLIEKVPHKDKPILGDSLSDVAPFRIVNIGRSEKIHLMDFIEEIETVLNKKAIKILCQCKWVMFHQLGQTFHLLKTLQELNLLYPTSKE